MMRNIFFILCALVLSCENRENKKPIVSTEEELAGINDTRNAFQKALKEKNYDILGNLVTPEFKTVSPGSNDWNSMYQMYPERGPFPYDSIIMNPNETIIVSDSAAYDFGVSRVFYTDTIGNVVELNDTFLVILKKGGDGVWRLHREVASSKVME